MGVAAFRATLPFVRASNPYARQLANYRDHALLIYDRRGPGGLRPGDRQFPRVAYAAPWADPTEQRSPMC